MRPLPPISPPEAEPTPMFDERRPREHRTWALPLFLLFSLLAHSLGFYIFHVVYPTPQDVPMPTATLNLVSIPEAGQETPGETQLLLASWLRDSDPALLATWRARSPDWARLDRGHYAPLFERWKLEPELAPLATPFTEGAVTQSTKTPKEEWNWRLGQTPLDLDPAWLGIEAAPIPALADASAGSPATQILLEPLAAGGPEGNPSAPPVKGPTPADLKLPPFHAEGESLGSVQNAEFLLGSGAEGQVLFTLTRRGSNSVDLDSAAISYLRALKLPKPAGAGARVYWWKARFAWGKEVFTQP